MCRLSRIGRILACALLGAGTVAAQTFSNNTLLNIQDASIDDVANCRTITVSGINGLRTVTNVRFINLNHTWIGDLEFIVWKPGATVGGATGFVQLAFPPSTRSCDYNGTYVFTDLAAQTIDAATGLIRPCSDAANDTSYLAAGNYRSSTAADDVGNPGVATSVPAIFGGVLNSAVPGQINGDWQVCINDWASGDTGTVAGMSMTFSAPTAATVSVGGRTTASGKGLSGTTVTITDASGNAQVAKSDGQGNYSFDDVQAGAVYTVNVVNKGYTFNPSTVVVPVDDNVTNLNFSGIKPRRR